MALPGLAIDGGLRYTWILSAFAVQDAVAADATNASLRAEENQERRSNAKAHISTEPPPSCQGARLSQPHENQVRGRRALSPSREGSPSCGCERELPGLIDSRVSSDDAFVFPTWILNRQRVRQERCLFPAYRQCL